MNRLERACVLAFLLPAGIVTVGAVWIAAGERMGFAPLAQRAPSNIAEAAALGIAGEVFRLLRTGEDPRRVYPTDPVVISSAILRVTALEAAMWSRQLEMIELLDREGAIPVADRPALACLAADLDLDDIVDYLAPQNSSRCEPGKAMERVAARTSSPPPAATQDVRDE